MEQELELTEKLEEDNKPTEEVSEENKEEAKKDEEETNSEELSSEIKEYMKEGETTIQALTRAISELKANFKKIVDEGATNGLYAIKLGYLGEPLICKDIVKMVAYAKDKGIVDVMFNTNGALLTKSMSEKLIKAVIDKIFI